MTHMGLKLSVAGVLLISAISYLAFAGVQRGWVYTMGVDQYVASTNEQKLRVRLCGTVSTEQLDVHKAQLTARFVLKGEHASVPVAYKGVIPDMFKPGSEVVVEGQLDKAGLFQ